MCASSAGGHAAYGTVDAGAAGDVIRPRAACVAQCVRRSLIHPAQRHHLVLTGCYAALLGLRSPMPSPCPAGALRATVCYGLQPAEIGYMPAQWGDMTGSPPAALARERHLSSRHGRHRPLLAALTAAVGLLSACGGGGAAPRATHSGTAKPTASLSGTAQPTATGSGVATAYCADQETPIPQAAELLQGIQVPGLVLTSVQQAWLQMGATMVPACSEITPDAPPVQTKNLRGGEISDADLSTWVQEDEKFWALVEWAQLHSQAGVIQYLYGGGGNRLLSFVLAGGSVADSQACKYPAKVYAVSVTAQQMSALTSGNVSTAGVVYVGRPSDRARALGRRLPARSPIRTWLRVKRDVSWT